MNTFDEFGAKAEVCKFRVHSICVLAH
jgi:hypothetical protein